MFLDDVLDFKLLNQILCLDHSSFTKFNTPIMSVKIEWAQTYSNIWLPLKWTILEMKLPGLKQENFLRLKEISRQGELINAFSDFNFLTMIRKWVQRVFLLEVRSCAYWLHGPSFNWPLPSWQFLCIFSFNVKLTSNVNGRINLSTGILRINFIYF